MRYLLTAAAQRAFAKAAVWSLGECSDTLEAPALLLGLLAEPECRAALTLARHAIDADAISLRWPSLVRQPNRFAAWEANSPGREPTTPSRQGGAPVRFLANDVQISLASVARKLRALGISPELGTEHILFGLAMSEHEVSKWLRERGVQPDRLEKEILRSYGFEQPSTSAISTVPLPFPEDEQEPLRALDKEETELGPMGSPPADSPNLGVGACVSGAIGPQERLRVLRVIDASADRAREGLRVVEDFVRFVLDDRFLTNLLKSLRHDLTNVLAQFPLGERLAARETQTDVGTQLATPGEQRRENTARVLTANVARLQESLRSLEEFTKILDPAASAALKQIRYQAYTLQRAVETTRSALERLGHARLYVLIDGRATLDEFRQLVRMLVCAGVHVLQLRDKQLDDRTLVHRARALREIASESGVLFVMNDRPDLAALSRADGVHVGQEELSVKDARAIVGPNALVGVSTHSIQQARQAVLDGADYIGVGPVFPSETKQFEQFPGVELLRQVAAEIRLPAFAIGGISLDSLPMVLETGLRRVAVGAAVSASASPAVAVRTFLDALR